jgi:carboxymethylenebutenolidase
MDLPLGYLANPPSGAGSGVLVLHAWWGLNETIQAFCRRLGESGFTAFAPDLYHGRVAETIPEAEKLGIELDGNFNQAREEVARAAAFLEEKSSRGKHGMAVIGFSMGAFYALDLAASQPERIRSVVLFYGTSGMGLSTARADFLGHFAENDPYEPTTNVTALEASLVKASCRVTFHTYPGTGHWFFEPDRPTAYDPTAASLAWERTRIFLNQSFHEGTNGRPCC